jgi:hypothetical protein
VVEGGTGVGEELAGGLGVGRLGMLGECCLDSGHGRGEGAAVELADRTVVGLDERVVGADPPDVIDLDVDPQRRTGADATKCTYSW